MFTALTGPYGLLIKWAAILGLTVVFGGFCYVKGIDHQQEKDEIAKADQIQKAEDLRQKQSAAQHVISQNYQDQLQHEKANSAALNAALKHALSLRLYVPANSVPSAPDRSSPDSQAGTSDVDAQFSAAVQHDSSRYAGCVNQLNALIDTIHAVQ